MANLSDLFPADTKRGRLAELLYQRSIAQPEPVPDVRSTPPQIMGGLLGMIDSAKRKVGKNLSELVNNPDQYLRLIAERLPETAQKMASDPGNFIGGGMLGTVGKVGKTQYELSHEVAQRNAALPVEQGGLGLSPTNTAMERARAMGFKDGIYHGGTNTFDAFKVSDRSNVYATHDPKIADIYANATGRHKALREVNAEPNVIPLMYRGNLAEVSDQGASGGGWYRENLANQIGITPSRTMIKELPNHGFSGVKINEMDDLGGRQTQYVFPDPSVLRSRFAAFDPFRRNESDLLAGIAPYAVPGVTIGALLGLTQGSGGYE